MPIEMLLIDISSPPAVRSKITPCENAELQVGEYCIKPSKFLASKKALINKQNKDLESFKWCITEATFPECRSQRVTMKTRENTAKFDWTGG